MNELEALESLAPLFQGGTMPLLDPVPIHPMFVRENWNLQQRKYLAPYPMRRALKCFWHVGLISFSC